ncbi:MAG: GIY-YIG nuclease family protein [Acholeplasmatales bacterium]|nr:GIY-YIG nuclease family protein [Acholeplasmatales bacterium]
MAYIYKITNNINDKIYIGQTNYTLSERLHQHYLDSKKQHRKNRPLYQAINKYGIENFSIELIEETDNPLEREIYWIEYYGSFKNGYNATMGGNGKRYLDYDLIISTYNQLQNINKVAKILNVDQGSISTILNMYNINIIHGGEVTKRQSSKIVAMIDKNTNQIIKVFSSHMDAARWLITNNKSSDKDIKIAGRIGSVVKGKRKTAYGYKWKDI